MIELIAVLLAIVTTWGTMSILYKYIDPKGWKDFWFVITIICLASICYITYCKALLTIANSLIFTLEKL